MPKYTQTHICNHEMSNLFDLLLNVESYPEFLPWCSASRVRKKTKNKMLADLVICFKGITESYCSDINFTQNEEDCLIKVEAIDGPFEHLTNYWRLKKISEMQTEITFEIDFRLKSRLLHSLLGGIFTKAQEKMLDAFEKRADAIWPK